MSLLNDCEEMDTISFHKLMKAISSVPWDYVLRILLTFFLMFYLIPIIGKT